LFTEDITCKFFLAFGS